ncbi:NAD-dependent epimerase/dehydratase family protein [Ramlibacter sp. AN1015]|uniref:UDP-2-acetamido-2,6-beta-L-arabino-hexul-4-ose reductase n=1 Tax=Ramlibacter sp. AN1015 TaxID=3133428 RepID=UPI0030BDB4A7
MRVLITGPNGFVGKNLRLRLSERKGDEVLPFGRQDDPATLAARLAQADVVVHLAGANRPTDPREFVADNAELTQRLAEAVADIARRTGRRVPVLYTSSIQARNDSPYGRSKRAGEEAMQALASEGHPVHVFRLPNVFGKWARPNYNSVVATFCHHVARDLPIQVNDPTTPLTLVYVDDVVDTFLRVIDGTPPERDGDGFARVEPTYTATLGELAHSIRQFRDSRATLTIDRVGTGLTRALYATYVSYLPPEAFAYPVAQHADPRGVFVEMLKTADSGQFSYFTAHPGVTRGGHYHHTKTEKFLVIKGQARFRFRHMDTGEAFELTTRGDEARIVETIPGWTHDITNMGADELVVMLWANEVFDRERPDTYANAL